ncbi:MAG: sugar phosphate nucleotidyltransferase [Candidatus Caldarchaeum sp.]|nr:sugar phosphate nucleotidyltransferase [Candidatus Caldarchaeum sp.]
MVFAAGYGKRLRPLTLNRPKHVLPLAGRPLVRMVVEALGKAGFEEVGVLVGYQAEKVKSSLQDLSKPKISFITQSDLLGTGAALKECRDYLAGEEFFAVVYGDVTVSADVVQSLLNMLDEGRYDGVLAAVETKETGRYGVLDAKENRLVRVGEKENRQGPVNAGIYILHRKIFDLLDRVGLSPRGEIELTDALNKFVSEGGGIGVGFFGGGWWFDIGNPADYLNANTVYLSRLYGRSINFERWVNVGSGTMFKGPVFIGNNVSFGRNCVVEGPAMVCEGSVVDDGTVVRNSVVLENCYIGKHSNLKDAVICEESVFVEGIEIGSDRFPAYVSDPGFKAEKRLKVV